jgi:hypothetical protein
MTSVLPQTERIPQMSDPEYDPDALVWLDENEQLRSLGSAALQLLFHNQKDAALTACMTAETAVTLLVCCLVRDMEDVTDRKIGEEMIGTSIAEAKEFARDQAAHLRKYMRQPVRDGIPPHYARFGTKIDRVGLQTAELLASTLDLYELPEKLKIRRDFVAEAEARRLARIEERRKKRAATPIEMAPPPVPVDKREKEEREPLCDKCGKRPRVSGTLCQKCAEWMMRR